MILPTHYYANDDPIPHHHHHDDDPIHHHHHPHFPRPGSIAFPYPMPQLFPPLSYPPPPRPHFPAQYPTFMPHQYPPEASPLPQPLLNDPAFSPDPRSNPHFFSMNDREEIYPASTSDSLSDYAPSVLDDESDIDHANLPPRMRLLTHQDIPPPLPQHARSQSAPYPPLSPPQHNLNLSRSSSARVIPVPPPLSRTSTPGSHPHASSRDAPHPNGPSTPAVYPSASLAAHNVWHPPPPYSDSDTDSSSSSYPQTPSSTPPSSSSSLTDTKRSAVPFPVQQPQSLPQPQPSSSSPSAQASQSRQAAQPNATPATHPLVLRPPINARNASAPELQPPPPPVDVPPRPSTVPIPAPNPEPSAPRRRLNSKNPSIAAAPRDLDRIDELDESDPLGFAWHHGGPYEAIAKAASTLHPDVGLPNENHPKASKRKPAQPYDSVSVGVAPGQIFPAFSQYQPHLQHAQQMPIDPSIPSMPPPGNFPVGSPPMSPLMLPVQRRVPPTMPAPLTQDQYSNQHMTPAVHNAPLPEPKGFQVRQQQQKPQPPPQSQRPPQQSASSLAPNGDASNFPLPNPYSPVQAEFPNPIGGPPSRRPSPPQAARPKPTPTSAVPFPASNAIPRPDIALPPQRTDKPVTSLLPRHLPKRLVMPAPLQPRGAHDQPLQPGQAHVELVARRHNPLPLPLPRSSGQSASSAHSSMLASTQHQHQGQQQQQQQQKQQQQQRAQNIPMSQGPKVLKKRHTVSVSAPPQEHMQMPTQTQTQSRGNATVPVTASNTTAAIFAARVRFAEPPREETKEERKRREKEAARREKEETKRAKEREREMAKVGLKVGQPPQGMFTPDYPEMREQAQAAGARSAGRKLSKRR